MVMVFTLELSAGISGYTLKSHASEIIEFKMRETMVKYNVSKEVTVIWDIIQQDVILFFITNVL